MAKREVRDCDRCKQETTDRLVNFCVAYGESRDVASGRSEEDVEYVDLCPGCAAAMVNFLRKDFTHEQGQKILDWINKGVVKPCPTRR